MANALQRCEVCGGLQDEVFMWVISGLRHCSICRERVLFRESQPEPEWMRRRRREGLPSKDMTYRSH